MKEDTTGKVMAPIQLTQEEARWVAHIAKLNETVLERSYVVIGPDNQKHWVAVFNEDFRKRNPDFKSHETWSPLNHGAKWMRLEYPIPNWVLGEPEILLQDDGFTSEEIEKAEAIMEGL